MCVHRIDEGRTPACVEACGTAGTRRCCLATSTTRTAKSANAPPAYGGARGSVPTCAPIPASATRGSEPCTQPVRNTASSPATACAPRLVLGLRPAGALAGIAAMYMETEGHWVTGMTNHVVWGLPHVFAFFFIISASGALNVASIGSVFGREDYQPLGRFSAALAFALLAGGLSVLVFDLGRADRLIITIEYINSDFDLCLERVHLPDLLRPRDHLPVDDDGPAHGRLLSPGRRRRPSCGGCS